MMRTFGLIGFPLSHSFSKKYFTQKFEDENIADCNYELFPIEKIELIRDLLSAQPSLCGLNVTIPYKLEVMPFLTAIDEAAAQIGAVNCIAVQRNGSNAQLKGYNTDVYGFMESLKPLLQTHHTKALVFGNGGAANAVKYALTQLGIEYIIVVRKPEPGTILYDEVTEEMLGEYQLLVNTTPLGMSPNYDSAPPIPYQYLTASHLAYDLVYNPEETLFLTKAKSQGATTKNGLEMLYLQAERSWQIWNGLH